MNVAGLERQLAAARHGVARIERQVEQRGRKLIGIDQSRPGIALQHRFDLDVLAKCRPQQLCGLDDQRVDVGLPRLQRLLAGEGQQMLGQIRAAFGGLVDHLGDCRELRSVGDCVGQDLDRAGDDREDVVEVVRDAAGELPDRFHLLRLAKSCSSAAIFSVRSRMKPLNKYPLAATEAPSRSARP